MLRRTLIAAIILISVSCTAAWAQWQKPRITVRKLPAGVDARSISEQSPTVDRFYFTKLSQQAFQRVQAWLAYDDENLYVAFKCMDSGIGKKTTISPEGEIVPDDDSASILLDMDNDGRTYHMFTTTAAGKQSTEHGKQFVRSPFEAEWAVTTKKDGPNWTAFLTVPFKALGVSTPTAGTRWGAQLSRYDPAVKYPAFWARVRKDAREVQRIGEIMFSGTDEVSASIGDIQIDAPGPQRTSVSVWNPTNKPAKMTVHFTSDGQPAGWAEVTAPSGASLTPIRFEYPFDGWRTLTVSVSDESGRVAAKSPDIPVRMGAYASRMAKYRSVAMNLNPPSEAVSDELMRVRGQITELSKTVEAAKGDKAKWNALRGSVDDAEKAVSRLRSLCADTKGAGYSVGTETALTKIMRDKLFEGQFGQPAKIELARNEFESTQVAVVANDTALQDVSVSVSELTGPDGAKIPVDRIVLNLVDFVKTEEPPYEIEYIGWYPDPIMDYAPFDLAKNSIRPVWVTVHAPEGIPAGDYKGTVTIKPSNARETVIPLEVQVWDFDVPTTPTLKTAFAFFPHQYRDWYGEPITPEQRRQAYKMLLEHRLNPTNIYSKTPQPDKEDIPFCVDQGMNAFNLAFIGGNKNETVRKELAELIRGYEGYLKQNGWWDRAYVYGFDELGANKYPDLRDMFGWVKQEFPDLPRMSTVLPTPELKGYVDYWVPLVANLDYEYSKQYIKDGDQVWWYICCGPERPFPNWFVDYPAMDPRILFWMTWKYEVPGFLYWVVNRWHANLEDRAPEIQKMIDDGKRWPEVPWKTKTTASFNGDGHLVYPGPDGKLLSSVRLEAVRDGIDDYEYFHILSSLVKQAETKPNVDKAMIERAKNLLKVREDVVKSTFEFTLDPTLLYEARREVAEMIERVKSSEK